MEWLIIFGLASSSYVVHKLLLFSFEHSSLNVKVTGTWRYIWGWIVFLSIFGAYFYYENTQTIKDGHGYYVNIFEKKDDQKNYRVPAIIYKDEDGYTLGEVRWSNGGKSTFNNDFGTLIIGEKVEVTEQLTEGKYKYWYVELTDKKVKEE